MILDAATVPATEPKPWAIPEIVVLPYLTVLKIVSYTRLASSPFRLNAFNDEVTKSTASEVDPKPVKPSWAERSKTSNCIFALIPAERIS